MGMYGLQHLVIQEDVIQIAGDAVSQDHNVIMTINMIVTQVIFKSVL